MSQDEHFIDLPNRGATPSFNAAFVLDSPLNFRLVIALDTIPPSIVFDPPQNFTPSAPLDGPAGGDKPTVAFS
jgi:hypothetical protein